MAADRHHRFDFRVHAQARMIATALGVRRAAHSAVTASTCIASAQLTAHSGSESARDAHPRPVRNNELVNLIEVDVVVFIVAVIKRCHTRILCYRLLVSGALVRSSDVMVGK